MAFLSFTGGPLAENCYVLYDENTKDAAVIDPGFMNDALEKAIGAFNVRYILLTHGHFDHIRRAYMVKELTAAPVVSLDMEKPLVEDAALNGSLHMLRHAITAKVDETVEDGDGFMIGGISVRVMHTPGHTAGGCCYVTDDAVFTGDTLMSYSIGRTDLPTGDANALMSSLQKLAALPGHLAVCGGHGSVTTLRDEKRLNPYLNF